MNIFVLDKNPKIAAQMHCDKHVVKMILETAQMLSTVYRNKLGNDVGDEYRWYKCTHPRHPCTLWVASDANNARWTIDLGIELGLEYTYRYGKTHKSMRLIHEFDEITEGIASDAILENFAQCMPDQYKVPGDPVKAYQNYYLAEKAHILHYTKREVPQYVKESVK